METLTVKCDSTLFDQVGESSLSEKQLLIFTGLTWDNLNELKDMMTSLRNKYEQSVSDYCGSIMKSFERDILPTCFGLQALNRDDIINNRTTTIAKKLFDVQENMFLICDGTYARHQKSTNSEYQRKSFSGQKKVPLCKPFTICATDGYVVDMVFLANQNDADILKIIMEDPNGLSKFLKEGDTFVLDRGFRDIKSDLEEKKFKVLMPALKGKRKQLTTEESNQSRFVTKIRWAVESVHGVLKQKYHLLDHKIDNKLLPNIGLYFRIASFLNNTFGKRFDSDVDTFDEVVQRMHIRKSVENTLAIEAEEKGSYQLSQSVSYLAEMIDKNGELNIKFVKNEKNVLKVEVQSRHVSRTKYRCFL
ncbi:hypothetical protein RF55_17732, partial [Lasius niger]